jgi:hypothetical protein
VSRHAAPHPKRKKEKKKKTSAVPHATSLTIILFIENPDSRKVLRPASCTYYARAHPGWCCRPRSGLRGGRAMSTLPLEGVFLSHLPRPGSHNNLTHPAGCKYTLLSLGRIISRRPRYPCSRNWKRNGRGAPTEYCLRLSSRLYSTARDRPGVATGHVSPWLA